MTDDAVHEMDQFRLKEGRRRTEVSLQSKAISAFDRLADRRFILGGAFSYPELADLVVLPGKALAVMLLLQHQARKKGSLAEITLANSFAAMFGVNADARRRALIVLAKAGFIRLRQVPGKTPVIDLLRSDRLWLTRKVSGKRALQ